MPCGKAYTVSAMPYDDVTENLFFDTYPHSSLLRMHNAKKLGLVAEPASPAKAGPARPAEAGAGCLSGPAGLGGKIYGITSLRINCNL